MVTKKQREIFFNNRFLEHSLQLAIQNCIDFNIRALELSGIYTSG